MESLTRDEAEAVAPGEYEAMTRDGGTLRVTVMIGDNGTKMAMIHYPDIGIATTVTLRSMLHLDGYQILKK